MNKLEKNITCDTRHLRKGNGETIRHTTALHLLESGVALSVIALWLGHEQIETTHQYMEANLEMKKSALNALPPIDVNKQHDTHKLSKGVVAFLESL
ncbi:MAG TPA: integrase [Gammaproteobacteria bacterium]|nr:integrase [Gammaproteobacteria bacterium]